MREIGDMDQRKPRSGRSRQPRGPLAQRPHQRQRRPVTRAIDGGRPNDDPRHSPRRSRDCALAFPLARRIVGNVRFPRGDRRRPAQTAGRPTARQPRRSVPCLCRSLQRTAGATSPVSLRRNGRRARSPGEGRLREWRLAISPSNTSTPSGTGSPIPARSRVRPRTATPRSSSALATWRPTKPETPVTTTGGMDCASHFRANGGARQLAAATSRGSIMVCGTRAGRFPRFRRQDSAPWRLPATVFRTM